MATTTTTTTTDTTNIETTFRELNEQISKYKPVSINLDTAQARLDYTNLNISSINLQTMILSIILVIFITIAFITHLSN